MEPRSFVVSSQVDRQGGTGDMNDELKENPVTITFSFKVMVQYTFKDCSNISQNVF